MRTFASFSPASSRSHSPSLSFGSTSWTPRPATREVQSAATIAPRSASVSRVSAPSTPDRALSCTTPPSAKSHSALVQPGSSTPTITWSFRCAHVTRTPGGIALTASASAAIAVAPAMFVGSSHREHDTHLVAASFASRPARKKAVWRLSAQHPSAMLVAQPASPNSHGADDVFVAARGGRTDALKALVGRGADINVADGSGTTPLMLAVLGGHLDTVLQLVMACGADMNRRDHSGRTALELAIAASNREASLALLLIATAKFSRPLSPLLPLTLLQRLQAWVADPKGKNEAAMNVVWQQFVAHLRGEGGGAALSAEERVWALSSLVATLVWSARHALAALCERIGASLAADGAGAAELCAAGVQDAEGHSVLHALVVAGRADHCRRLLLALPPADARALLRRRSGAGRRAHEMAAAPDLPPALHAAAAAAAAACWGVWGEIGDGGGAAAAPMDLAGELANPNATPAALQAAAVGRGGAVRRRKSEGQNPVAGAAAAVAAVGLADGPPPPSPGADESDGSTTAAAAAGDLMQLAAAATAGGAGGAAGAGAGAAAEGAARGARAGGGRGGRRDSKPYQRPKKGGRGKGGEDCWLPGGFWWQDTRMPMPPGRQPGELAGWTPLAGEGHQQRIQEQRDALSAQETFVQGLESRAEAAAYLQALQGSGTAPMPPTEPGEHPSPSTNVAVDDSVIARQSTFKQLASWGGFRRHFKAQDAEAAPDPSPAPADAALPVEEQLQRKRQEVMAARQQLDVLMQQQLHLEAAVRGVHPPGR